MPCLFLSYMSLQYLTLSWLFLSNMSLLPCDAWPCHDCPCHVCPCHVGPCHDCRCYSVLFDNAMQKHTHKCLLDLYLLCHQNITTKCLYISVTVKYLYSNWRLKPWKWSRFYWPPLSCFCSKDPPEAYRNCPRQPGALEIVRVGGGGRGRGRIGKVG